MGTGNFLKKYLSPCVCSHLSYSRKKSPAFFSGILSAM